VPSTFGSGAFFSFLAHHFVGFTDMVETCYPASMLDEIPKPFKISDNGSAFVVKDGTDRTIACFYYHDPAVRFHYLTKDEARQCAQAFARLSKV
jgi:hypothetical protein